MVVNSHLVRRWYVSGGVLTVMKQGDRNGDGNWIAFSIALDILSVRSCVSWHNFWMTNLSVSARTPGHPSSLLTSSFIDDSCKTFSMCRCIYIKYSYWTKQNFHCFELLYLKSHHPNNSFPPQIGEWKKPTKTLPRPQEELDSLASPTDAFHHLAWEM